MLCAIGVCAMAATPVSAPVVLALAAIVIGCGYGPITPASSHLLQRTAPPSRLALTFSIKQTGVPAGVALAGAVLPAVTLSDRLARRVRDRCACRRGRARASRSRFATSSMPIATRDARFSLGGIFAPLALLRQRPALLELALVSLVYSAMQVVLTSFLVCYLTETLHWSLVSAGFALTAATLGGVAGRIGWGHVADRLLHPVTC